MLTDDLVQIEHRGCEHLLPAEREQLAGEVGGALARALDFSSRRRASGRRRRAPPAGTRCSSRIDREQVVEVVRHAAGEPADGFHLLRLAQLLLRPAQRFFQSRTRHLGKPAVGDVDDTAAAQIALWIGQTHEAHLAIEVAAGGVAVEPFEGGALASHGLGDVLAGQLARTVVRRVESGALTSMMPSFKRWPRE